MLVALLLQGYINKKLYLFLFFGAEMNKALSLSDLRKKGAEFFHRKNRIKSVSIIKALVKERGSEHYVAVFYI